MFTFCFALSQIAVSGCQFLFGCHRYFLACPGPGLSRTRPPGHFMVWYGHLQWGALSVRGLQETTGMLAKTLWNGGLNPNWHELRKQEKCSSLAPPRSKFYKTQWAWQGVKLTRLMSIFTSKKVWKFLIQIQLTKSNPKITRGVKVPCLMPIRVKNGVDLWVKYRVYSN